MATLTMQNATAVMATVQKLIHKRETGQDATEEQLARRMMGSVFEMPGEPITTAIASSQNGASTRSAVTYDRLDDLIDDMNDLTKPPKDQVDDGKIPLPPPVAVLPNYSNKDIQANYATLVDATSVCSLYTNMMKQQTHPGGFDITKDAPTAFAFFAQTTWDVMNGALAGFYNFTVGSRQTYNNTIPISQVHENLIGKVFDPFKFDKDTKAQLDGQLTTFMAAIKGLNTTKSQPNTLDFCIRLNMVPKINVTGDPSDEDGYVYMPCTWLIYMKVNAKAYQQSISKNNSQDMVQFAFELTVTKCELNTRLFESFREKFDGIFEGLMGENLAAFSQKVSKDGEIKSNEDNPGANITPP